LDLADNGVLEKYGVELIGASREAIRMAEDRELFRVAMSEIGLECPKAAVALEVIRQALGIAPVAGPARYVAHDQAGGMHAVGFGIHLVAAGVADMRVSKGDDLTGIGGIGEDLLVAGHGGIENHFANGFASRTDGVAVEYAAVFEGKQSGMRHVEGRLLGTARSASRVQAGLWTLGEGKSRAG
jgi:hypothetical protein